MNFWLEIEAIAYIVVVFAIVVAGSEGKPGPAYLLTAFFLLIGFLIGIPFFTVAMVVLLFMITATIIGYYFFLGNGGPRSAF